jgi:hypothetical protein
MVAALKQTALALGATVGWWIAHVAEGCAVVLL